MEFVTNHLTTQALDVFLNTFIAGYADAEFHGADYWIGATTNYLGGGNWSWSDYNPFGYSNFVNEQSVNTFGYCASQNLPDGKWKNSSCTLQKPYICEYLPTKFCAPACPNGFTYYAAGEKCYKLLKPVNFTDGINQCKTLYDGNLASIHSKDETQFLTSVFSIDPNVIAFIDNNTTAYKRYVWIGLQDPTHTLNYTWIDGTSVDYTNWAYNEPDDANGIQHCGALQGVTISCLHHSFDNISVS
uniref:C-type lectin domain-containing protein n=1 Tax=Acrobeloides nanus TaxID=290746 RepID=A0A914ECQ9_9BILA